MTNQKPPLPRCERCESDDDVRPVVTQVGGRPPYAELLCAGHRRSLSAFAAALAPYTTIVVAS